MPILAPPFGPLRPDPHPAQPRGRKGRTVGQPPGEARVLRSGDMVAHDRMRTVRSDRDIGLDFAAVSKRERDARPPRLDTPEPLAADYARRRHAAGPRRMQVAPLDRQLA